MGNIYIIGFMGTGKTVVGKQVARQLNQWFVDLDLLIEQKEKRKISQIFAEDGEAHFRMLEKQILAEVAKAPGSVVSCGGGIVLDKGNIQVMKDTGVMICLSAKPEVILERTRRHKHRPLLDVDNPTQKIDELLKVRAPFYAQADYAIDTSDLSVDAVVYKVLEYVKKRAA